MKYGYFVQTNIPVTIDDIEYACAQYHHVTATRDLSTIQWKMYRHYLGYPSQSRKKNSFTVSFALDNGPGAGSMELMSFDDWYNIVTTLEAHCNTTKKLLSYIYLSPQAMEWLRILYTKRDVCQLKQTIPGISHVFPHAYKLDTQHCTFCMVNHNPNQH